MSHQNVYPVLNKLKVLSKVEAGQKILMEDTQIEIMQTDKSYIDRIRKLWLGENRWTTINKLRGLHLEFKDLASELEGDMDQVTLKRLLTELSASLRGLSNLMLTYADDKTIVSQLETLHENFTIEISYLKQLLEKQEEEFNLDPM